MTRMSSIYEWHDRALALPGAPDIWLKAQMGDGLVAVGGRLGLYGIASDGTWWEPTGRSDKPWLLNTSHPATEGVLLRLIGAGVFGFWMAEKWKNTESEELGQSCIRVAEMIGKWPRGGG